MFEGTGVDAVLGGSYRRRQEAGEESPARHRVVDRWNGTKRRTGVWVMRPPHKRDGTIYCASVYVGRCSVWGVLQIPTRNGKNFSELSGVFNHC